MEPTPSGTRPSDRPLVAVEGSAPSSRSSNASSTVDAGPAQGPGPTAWWRRAVVYQIYIRSFADADGDGIGDVEGIRGRLPYLRDLGVDAIWITPWYRSPMVDGGYDVADHEDIDPLFGTLADADALLADAHALGIRVLLDLVPNHTSAAHPWFRAALAGNPGSAERSRYVFRDGTGPGGDVPPNGWPSIFGGPAWTRVTEPDGTPGQWYLHTFDPQQPDLDWETPAVLDAFAAIIRHWFDRGVDGFRVDVASGMFKDYRLADVPPAPAPGSIRYIAADHPLMDQPGLHPLYRAWRAIADTYEPPRVLLGEVHVSAPERLAAYVRGDELHGAFNFPFLRATWDVGRLRDVIDETLATHHAVGAAPSWVLNCHDETRTATRYGRPFTGIRDRLLDDGQSVDAALGLARARAGALLLLALPGAANVYQGEELGLPEVEDLPVGALRDPVWERSGRTIRGRDGCRVPLPWTDGAPPCGFGPGDGQPWLPQPAGWGARSVEAQARDPFSTLTLYRHALAIRRRHPGLGGTAFAWLPSPDGVLHFERDGGFRCVVNVSGEPFALPHRSSLLVRSDAPAAPGDLLPPGAAAWYLP